MTCDRLNSIREGDVVYFPIVVLPSKVVCKLRKTPTVAHRSVGCYLVATSTVASCGYLVSATILPRTAIVSCLSAKIVHLCPPIGAIFWVSLLIIQRSFPRPIAWNFCRAGPFGSLAPNRPAVSDDYFHGPGHGLSSQAVPRSRPPYRSPPLPQSPRYPAP
jgi:hypothetical protein